MGLTCEILHWKSVWKTSQTKKIRYIPTHLREKHFKGHIHFVEAVSGFCISSFPFSHSPWPANIAFLTSVIYYNLNFFQRLWSLLSFFFFLLLPPTSISKCGHFFLFSPALSPVLSPSPLSPQMLHCPSGPIFEFLLQFSLRKLSNLSILYGVLLSHF